MKEKMTIGEYAKLRKVTAETLRHYDRIGLFHPFETDPNSGYRYYSIIQDEKLGTIRELQHLGMSIDEIKAYFNNRNLDQSFELLQQVQIQLQDRIKTLQRMEKTLTERMNHLAQIMQHTDFETITIKEFPERLFIHAGKHIDNAQAFHYASLKLEHALHESTPLLASNRLGIMLDYKETNPERGIPFILIRKKNTADPAYIHKIPTGKFACKIFKGSFFEILNEIKKINDWLYQHGMEGTGPILQIILLDISVTDRIENEVMEIQVPVKTRT